LVAGFVEVAFDGRVLDGAIHSFDLPIGPWMLGLSLEGGLDVRRRRARIAWGGEVGSVVGEDDMDLVRDGGDQAAQEVRRATFSCSLTKANFDVRSMATSR